MSYRNTAIALVAAACATAATASVDTTPKPGGVYKLKPGIYVQKGTPCGSAPNAAVRRYDGRGIATAHTRSCRARILNQRGHTYRVTQTCVGAGAGKATTVIERQTVDVQDALSFSIRTTGAASAYRYCPAYNLPSGLKESTR